MNADLKNTITAGLMGGVMVVILMVYDFILTASYLRYTSANIGYKHFIEPFIFTIVVLIFFWAGALGVRMYRGLNSTFKDAVKASAITGITIGITGIVGQFIIFIYERITFGANHISSMSLLIGGLSCIPFEFIFFLMVSIAGGIFYKLVLFVFEQMGVKA